MYIYWCMMSHVCTVLVNYLMVTLFKQVIEEIRHRANKLSENERWVVVMHDEMSIKADMVSQKFLFHIMLILIFRSKNHYHMYYS